MDDIKIKCGIFFFSRPNCKYCKSLESDLKKHNTPYTKYIVEDFESTKIKAATGQNTFPILYIDKVLIGGYSEYKTLCISNQIACDF